jgi:hypothetical protein
MLHSDEIRHRVSAFLSDELVSQAQGEVAGAGVELSSAEEARLRRGVAATTDHALSTPRIARIWRRANRAAHRSLLRILNEDAGSNGDAVELDLNPAVRLIAAEISFGGLRLGAPPPSLGRIVVFDESQLQTTQSFVRWVRHLPLIAGLVVLVLFGLALLAAASLPRGLLAIGLSLAAAGALALIARVIAGHQIADALVGEDGLRAVGYDAWEIVTSTAFTLAVVTIVAGALIALVAGAALFRGRERRLS